MNVGHADATHCIMIETIIFGRSELLMRIGYERVSSTSQSTLRQDDMMLRKHFHGDLAEKLIQPSFLRTRFHSARQACLYSSPYRRPKVWAQISTTSKDSSGKGSSVICGSRIWTS